MFTKIKLFDSDIYMGSDCLSQLRNVIKKLNPSRVFIILDRNSKRYCLNHLVSVCKEIKQPYYFELKQGENEKSLENCQKIFNYLIKQNADRKSLIINLGGGVISDFGGFVSSVFKRGIKFVNIPTTLMAQIDASIGGKVGVNLNIHKNQIGCFNLPHSVFINYEFIKTISFDNLNASFSEILKYGLIYDQKLWQELDSTLLTCGDLSDLIEKCVRIKLEIVKNDYYDNNVRRILNFGHTISHAIESMYLYKGLIISHGDALAVGLICETYLSHVEFGFSRQKLNHIVDKISSFFNFKKIETLDHKPIIKFIKNDKKSSIGSNNFTLIKNIGSSVINCNVPNAKIVDALNYFKEKCQV
tara:strand:- start:436 stop:1509 length:1074 start_codon:yes stop_codon:yes gene_type:complete